MRIWPISESKQQPQICNINSNHPQNVIKAIPEGVNQRLTSISSNKQTFDRAKGPYQEALKNAGYEYELNFNPQPQKNKK